MAEVSNLTEMELSLRKTLADEIERHRTHLERQLLLAKQMIGIVAVVITFIGGMLIGKNVFDVERINDQIDRAGFEFEMRVEELSEKILIENRIDEKIRQKMDLQTAQIVTSAIQSHLDTDSFKRTLGTKMNNKLQNTLDSPLTSEFIETKIKDAINVNVLELSTQAMDDNLGSKINDILAKATAELDESKLNDLFSTEVPVGTILPYFGPDAPPGYLKCDGQKFAQGDYSELYSLLIKTDPALKVNESQARTPNLKGRFLRGIGGSAKPLGQFQAASVGPHDHYLFGNTQQENDQHIPKDDLKDRHPAWAWLGVQDHDGYEIVAAPEFSTKGMGKSFMNDGEETLPMNMAVNYIIKARRVFSPTEQNQADSE